MKTLVLCIILLSSLFFCGCQSLPMISTTGDGRVTIKNTKPEEVLVAARKVYIQQGYHSVPSESANSVSFDKPAEAFKGIDLARLGDVKSVRVILSVQPTSDANTVQADQKAYAVSSSQSVSSFSNVYADLTLWNSELGSILAKIAQQSSVK